MTATQSPVQDITKAEAAAAAKVENAKKLAHEEVEAYKKGEADRVEKEKAKLKDTATEELKKEKDGLNAIVTDGAAGTKKEVDALKGTVEKKKGGLVASLVDQFISFFTS